MPTTHRRARKARIVVAGCDPSIVALVDRHETRAAGRRRRPDLVVVEATDREAVGVAARAKGARVLALADDPAQTPACAHRVLIRPISPSVIHETIDELLDERLRPRLDQRPARLAAGGLVAVAAMVVASGRGAPGALSTLATLPLILAAGYLLGAGGGSLAGTVVSLTAGRDLVLASAAGRQSTRATLAWLVLFPLAGTLGGVLRRIRTERSGGLLAETNRVLSRLHAIARQAPSGLDADAVGEAICDELRETLGVAAGAVVGLEAGRPRVLASFGFAGGGELHGPLRLTGLDRARAVQIQREDPALADALGAHGCMLVAPARRDGRLRGLVVAACPSERRHDPMLAALERLVADAAVAVENAELFRRVRALAVGDERRRIAGRMHEGLAQTLTHLRLELDYMARHGGGDERLRENLRRLSSVIDRAVGDVRTLMDDLRTAPGERAGSVPERRPA